MRVPRGFNIIILSLIAIIIAYFNYFTDQFKGYDLEVIKVLQSVIILLVAYVANYLLSSIIKRQLHGTRERYVFRKTISTIISIVALGILITVWLKETTSLIVAYGILSAGIAIALQDVLRNIAGGIIIFVSGPFKAGDRIQVEGELGDVLDIRIFYVTIMEIREWVDGDQYSGRIIQLPSSFILNKTVKNYTRDFSFIWDEIHLMVTFDSNWKKAQEKAVEITNEITLKYEINAKQELSDLGERYLITPSDVESRIYTKITDNWIDLRLRYVVDPHERRKVKHLLSEKILEAFQAEKDIRIASESIEISGIPSIRFEK